MNCFAEFLGLPRAMMSSGDRGHAPYLSPPSSSHLEPASSSLALSPPTGESTPAPTMDRLSVSSLTSLVSP